jgi:DNA-binding beta-propeller fold protein YncE
MRSFILAALGAGLAGCGAGGADLSIGSDAPLASSDAGSPGCLSSNECPTGWTCNDFGYCEAPPPVTDGGTPPPPPETEYSFGAPVSSARFVYVAMTAEDKLARIDGSTLAVKSTAVGKSPSVVAAIPNADGAVVLDATNGTATVVRPAQLTTDPDIIRTVATLPNLNRLDVDPTGRFAVAWFDLTKQLAGGGLGGIGSFQDVTVLALTPGAEHAVNLTVGFRPRKVQFDAIGGRAFVVTADGVSVIDLADATSHGPAIVPPIAVADPTIDAADLEVNVVATGAYAAVRQAGVAALRVVSLAGPTRGQAWVIPLTSVPSDVDLAPDGARVFVVEREAKQLAVVDVPGDAIDPTGVETIDLADATLGSLTLAPDGASGLLYTNAVADPRITFVRFDQPGYPHVTWPLKKSVRAVGMSPSGTTALVLLAKAPGDPATSTSVADFIDKSYGYAMLDLATGFSKLQLTPVDPGPFAYRPDGGKVYVALDGGDAVTAVRALQLVDTVTGVVRTIALGSPPSAVGILPGADQAFVSQRHVLGRVSFVALIDDAVRTVTGFDLNSQIVP